MVSVIVPAYNAQATIERCLDSLQKQTVPRDTYEIIVVDDGSTDQTPQIARAYDGVKVFTQKNQGAGVARNLGAEKATGDIILFTDSDCAVEENWIEGMMKPFSDPNIVGAKGFYKTKQKQVIARFVQLEHESKYDFLRRHKYIDLIDTYSAGYRRNIFLENGGFDSIYSTASGEDMEFSYKLTEKGYKLGYSTSAFVYHLHPDTLRKYLKRKYRNAYWRIATWHKHPKKALKDSHTSLTMRMQTALCLAMVVFLFGGVITLKSTYLVLISGMLFLFTTIPFSTRATKREGSIGIISPMVIFLRTLTFLLGLGVGACAIAANRVSLRPE